MASMTRRQLWMQLLLYPGHTLPTAAAPVLVGMGLAWRDGVFAPLPVAAFMLSSWFIHVAGVLMDNHELLRRHPTLPEHPELIAALADRRLALSTLRWAIALCLLLALASGAYLLVIGGAAAVLIGAIGLASSLGYHGGPWPYVKRGWADPIFIAMFGVVAPAALYYVQAITAAPAMPWLERWTSLPWSAWLAGLPVGALVTNVMVIDDMRDRDWDAQKGWRTGAVRWGLGWCRFEFTALMLLAYLAPLAMLLLGLGAWTALPLATLPLALPVLRTVRRESDARVLQPWTPRMARVALIYAALLALGLVLSGR
jgi:1,4-dihydroxy-2-naphthoate polyprenyltransferase